LLREAGTDGRFLRTDVSQESEVASLVDETVATYGRLDYAVNNAGIEATMGVSDATGEQFDAMVATNTKGVFFCMQHEIRHMRALGGARSSILPQFPVWCRRRRRASTECLRRPSPT
jgi:NAD(P)-dependent dehydrogenase (short-subunit alcohol dehydrogenase family)